MKGRVQHMAVEAPIGPEYHDDTFMRLGRFEQGVLDLSVRVGAGMINVLIGGYRLQQAGRIGPLLHDQAPLLPPAIAQICPSVMYTVCTGEDRGGLNLRLEKHTLQVALR